MNKREMKKFETLLFEERARLSRGLKTLEEETQFDASSDHTADISSYAEVGTDNYERETMLTIASNESARLSEVDEALERIKEGTYGTCLGCEKEIMRKRLEVFPSAKYCVECQSKIEKEGYL
ncbi:MAG: hypothetical protein AMXMBFR84_12780 [Candidatus Hydrogenedentota bacterium]